MIGALVERLPRHVTAADFVAKTDDTSTAVADAMGDVSLSHASSAGLHARLIRHGRVGWAGGDADSADEVLARALASAATGPALDLMLPAPSPLSEAADSTRVERAASPELVALARGLRDRLARPGRRVEVWAERSVGTVRVANTRGVMAEYRAGLAGVGAVVGGAGTPAGAPLRVDVTGVHLPGQGSLDELARMVDRWTGIPTLEECESGPVRALLQPEAVRTVFGPVLLALAGEPWCERGGSEPFTLDQRLTLWDDPLVPGRPGSRPICDDGVPTRPMELVRRGRPVRGILDLATAARYGRPATGHGVRPALGAPRPGYSNLRLAPGGADAAALLRTLGTGVLVLDLPWGPAPNRAAGSFRARCPWLFAVRQGEIVGRVEGAVVAGNSFELLRNVCAVGADAEWRGAWCLPPLVVDGLRLHLP